MKVKTSLLIQLGLFLLGCGVCAYYWTILPDRIPTHWNIHNQVDAYGSKTTTLILLPSAGLISLFLTLVLPKLSPRNFEIDRFETTFAMAMVFVAALFLYLSIIILRATLTNSLDISRMIMAGIFGFFAGFGNLLGRVRRNFYMGIRTPWTLASEKVWDATHRSAGHLWFVVGLIGAALALVGMPVVASIVLITVMALWPVVNSYFLYQKLEGKPSNG